MSPVRTRFAPSPTGYLHVGGARTALYNWLYARHTGGQFFLRIEDTDKARSTDENTRAIFEGLRWLGLGWDNPTPMLQSTRTEIYRAHVEKLLTAGKAYRCYCTPEELEAKRKAAEAAKGSYRYDRACRRRTAPGAGPYVVRAAFEEEGETVVRDLIKGDVTFPNKELSDEVILRADGSPLYNLCVVVDDHEMGITHVLRGDDHLNNTPKQIQLYRAFGWELPAFGHMPLIFGPDKKKLSKRNSTVAVDDYRRQGYLPQAMINFLARIGWGHGDEEIFTTERLVEVFTIEGIGKSHGVFDVKKLQSIDLHWIKHTPAPELANALEPFARERGWTLPEMPVLERMFACTRERSQTLVQMLDQLRFWFEPEPVWDPKAVEKGLKGKGDLVKDLAGLLAKTEPYDVAAVEAALKGFADERRMKMGDIAMPLRVGLTGGTVSPPIGDVIALLGKARVAERLEKARALT